MVLPLRIIIDAGYSGLGNIIFVNYIIYIILFIFTLYIYFLDVLKKNYITMFKKWGL